MVESISILSATNPVLRGRHMFGADFTVMDRILFFGSLFVVPPALCLLMISINLKKTIGPQHIRQIRMRNWSSVLLIAYAIFFFIWLASAIATPERKGPYQEPVPYFENE